MLLSEMKAYELAFTIGLVLCWYRFTFSETVRDGLIDLDCPLPVRFAIRFVVGIVSLVVLVWFINWT